ncbi:MAG: hypothetical protein ACYTG4_01075, partial [Planctomycetota bacterium]
MEGTREGPLGTRLRRYGIIFFALAALLPFHGCRLHPEEIERPNNSKSGYSPEHTEFPAIANWLYFLDQWTGK